MMASALGRRDFALLTTFRKNGQGVPTAIWFVLGGDDRAYFMTGPETGKARRIRNNPSVQLAPSSASGKPQGPAVAAAARLLQGAEADAAQRALAKRYGLQWTLFGFVSRLRGLGKQVFYEVTETVP
jgi:uncharacterized protein